MASSLLRGVSNAGALSRGISNASALSRGTSNASKLGAFEPIEEAPPKTFHEAAERGNTNLVLKWIERTMDFDINQTDKLARTALHWAAEAGHQETAQTLLDFGANVKAVECNGRTAFHLAARSGNVPMLQLLLDAIPADERTEFVNQGDHNDITPVFLALQKSAEGQAAVEFLLSQGARYNQQGYEEAAAKEQGAAPAEPVGAAALPQAAA